jgi:hypothetical protein
MNAVAGTIPYVAFAGIAALLAVEPALGEESRAVTVDVGRCLELESAAARRDCFAAQVDEVLEERATAESDRGSAIIEESESLESESLRDPADVEQQNSATEPPARRERRRQRVAEAPAADARQPAEAEREEFFGTIREFEERLPNAYLITLEDGQVWQQVQPEMYPLRPGLEVRIYSTNWGESYRLIGTGIGRYIQVRRVR